MLRTDGVYEFAPENFIADTIHGRRDDLDPGLSSGGGSCARKRGTTLSIQVVRIDALPEPSSPSSTSRPRPATLRHCGHGWRSRVAKSCASCLATTAVTFILALTAVRAAGGAQRSPPWSCVATHLASGNASNGRMGLPASRQRTYLESLRADLKAPLSLHGHRVCREGQTRPSGWPTIRVRPRNRTRHRRADRRGLQPCTAKRCCIGTYDRITS